MYVKTDQFKPLKIAEVKGPAVSLPLPSGSVRFLITGGDAPKTIALDAPRIGRDLSGFAGKGIVFQDVSFEVDLDSSFIPAFVDQPIGALIRSQRGLEIVVVAGGQFGFEDLARITVDGTDLSEDQDAEVGFTRWKAFVGTGDDRREVLAFEATKKGNF